MNDEINIIFTRNKKYLIGLEKVIKEFRCQNYYVALQSFQKVIAEFTKTLDLVFRNQNYLNQQYSIVDEQTVIQFLKNIMSAQENEDYILLADLIEIQLIPFLMTIQNVIQQNSGQSIKQNFEKENFEILKKVNHSLFIKLKNIESYDALKYQIENTSIGVYTLKISNNQDYYMHSNGNPYKEADLFVDTHYDSSVHKYIVLGLGLGYHIHSLFLKNPTNKIEVYETDINVIKLAFTYSDMKDLLNSKRVNIHYDPDLGSLIKQLRGNMDDKIFLLHQPSIRNIQQKEIRHSFEEYFMFYSSLKNQEEILHTNFMENIKLKDPSVDTIRKDLEGKNLIVVAGGPSLDKNIESLQNYYFVNSMKTKSRDSKLIVVGTVLKKVLDLGIIPDYVIMTDAQSRIKKQLENVDTSLVPLIYLSTVTFEVPINYHANRYIIFQEDFGEAKDYGKQIGVTLFKTGGSVVTTALDLGIRMKCASLIFAGLDLAYTNLQTHTDNTIDKVTIDDDQLREVLSVERDTIFTSKNLDSYRKWIEKRIEGESHIKFIDATEGGALIHGMEIRRLSEVLS